MLLTLSLALQLRAQGHADGRAPRLVTAVRVARGPAINGRLDESVWRVAPPARGFIQQLPNDGRDPSESTTVRILYDDQAMYIGARLWDDRPALIARQLSRRDASVQSDGFWVDVDSYHDHRTAFEFGVSAAGVKQDDITSNDQLAIDYSWDPVWEVAVTSDSLGWVAEMRIPFSQLRFQRGTEQVWGINFFRQLFRSGEFSMYSHASPTESGYASHFAHLIGLRDIPSPQRLEIIPYVSADARAPNTTAAASVRSPQIAGAARAGVDLKYGVTPNLTLDASVNPDFGQVDADPAVVNLTAFEPFFEERRPLFVEGASIFAFGGTGSLVAFDGSPRWFYSRRIGHAPIDPGLGGQFSDIPAATAIVGAAKLTGKTANGWSVGLFDAVTGPERAPFTADSTGRTTTATVEPLTNYVVARLRRDFDAGTSGFGVLATAVDRDTVAAARLGLRARAYVVAADFFHRWDNNTYSLLASAGRSMVSGDTLALAITQHASSRYFGRPDSHQLRFDPTRTSLSGTSADIALNKDGGDINWALGASTTSPGFEVNDLGFQTRADRISGAWYLGERWPTAGSLFRFATVSSSGGATFNYDGNVIDAPTTLSAAGQLLNYWGGSVALTRSSQVLDDRLTRGGPLARRPESWNLSGNISSDGRARLTGSLGVNYGVSREGGWSVDVSPTLSFRASNALSFRLTPDISSALVVAQFVDAVRDSFAVATYGTRYIFAPLHQRQLSLIARSDVTFSPTLSLQIYAQPFVFSGAYGAFKELSRTRSFRFSVYGTDNHSTIVPNDPVVCPQAAPSSCFGVDPDGPGPASAFPLTNPTFGLRSYNANTVLRWEYRPGSTLFVVWSQERGATSSFDPTFGGAPDLVRAAFGDRVTNVFLVKLNYWINR